LKRINSLTELEDFRVSLTAKKYPKKMVLRTCDTGCRARRSLRVIEALEREIAEHDLSETVEIKRAGSGPTTLLTSSLRRSLAGESWNGSFGRILRPKNA
jgi:hypothetical protein